jgi:hypothetical protein
MHIFSRVLFIAYIVAGCNSSAEKTQPITAMETAQYFLRCEMSGLFKEAELYLLPVKENKEQLQKKLRLYESLNQSDKKRIQSADIEIDTIEEPSDSHCIMHYRDVIEKEKATISIKRVGDKWLVDLRPAP